MKPNVRRIWLVVGLLILVLGIASLFVPIPQAEKHGIEVGNLELGVEREVTKPVHPAVSGVIIVAGVIGIVIGLRR